MRQRYGLVLVLGAVLLLVVNSVTADQGINAGTYRQLLPMVLQSGSPVQEPVVPPPDEATNRLTVPPGFAVRIFAEQLAGRPRFMAIGPDGMLYLTLMNDGHIARLPDRDGNGRADKVEIVASGLSLPHGIEWRGHWLYLAEGDKISRLRDADSNGTFETKQLVTNNIPAPEGHSSRTVHFGPDGKLYVSAGSKCNIPVNCAEDDPRRATIMRFNADGTIPSDNPFVNDPDVRRRPIWAEGLRNSVDFLWAPHGQLWANHNGSDGLGDNTPPEEIVIPVQSGRAHGWPYCYTPTVGLTPAGTREVRDQRVPTPTGFDCNQAVPALLTDAAHSAPLGMTLAAGANFPPVYHDDLFVAYHGSWNTNNVSNYRDCKVQRVVIENGAPVASETFITGWRSSGQKCSAAWGRPADVIFAPDGSMLISDDHAGRVYRVVYVGQR